MKSLIYKTLATTSLLVSLVPLANSSLAYEEEKTTYYCGKYNGKPTTFFTSSIHPKPIPIIQWITYDFAESGYDPLTRCKMVSSQFRTLNEEDRLGWIVPGIKNNLNIICSSATRDGECNDQLFTLKKGVDPSDAIKELYDIDVSQGESGYMKNSSYALMKNVRGQTVINIDGYINSYSRRINCYNGIVGCF